MIVTAAVITAAAVTYGYMKPPEEVTAPAKNVPIVDQYHSSSVSETPSAEKPRFVYDEPLSKQPLTTTEPSSTEIRISPDEGNSEPTSVSSSEPAVILAPT